MFDYPYKTTFFQDFSIADRFGLSAVEDTYKRAFEEWKSNVVYITELVIVLNHKIWQHYEKNKPLAELYNKLWMECDEWCATNLKGDDIKYYYRTID